MVPNRVDFLSLQCSLLGNGLGNTDCESSLQLISLLFETLQRVQFMAVGLPGMLDTALKPVADLE